MSSNENTSELMKAKEKANELYSKYDDLLNKDFINPIVFDNQLKQCALIAVDEILHITCLKDFDYKQYFNSNSEFINYWEEVKIEIENL